MEYIYRVFVTDMNPVETLQGNYSGCIFQDFDTMKAAHDFAILMLDNGFNISLNVWKVDED